MTRYMKLLPFFILIITVMALCDNVNSIGYSNSYHPLQKNALGTKSFEDVKVLAIIANHFGDAYFWVKLQLEYFGCNFTTAGLTPIVASCLNKPPRPVTADILISNITDEILQQFDCVFIPPGAHWISLKYNTDTLDLLNRAYELGLVISTMCIGLRVVAETSILNNVKTVYFSQTYPEMIEAGAIIMYDTPVVADKRIVTATNGTCKDVNPYVYPFCVALVKEVLGYSSIVSITAKQTSPSAENNYTLTIRTDNLSDIFYGNLSTTITCVKAQIFYSSNPNENTTILLLDEDTDGFFKGTFINENKGRHYFDIEISSEAWGTEVVRNAATLRINFPSFIILISFLTINYFILLLFRKRK